MCQIKNLTFLIIIIFIFINLVFYDLGFSHLTQMSQESQAHFIPHSEEEKQLAALIHRQIYRENFDEFMRLLDRYPQYINIVNFSKAYKSYLTPLQYAVRLERDRFIDELLKRGADPTLPTLSEGNTLLHISPLLRITEKLIALNRIDIETYNFQGMTPLLSQVSKTHIRRDVIYALLKAGANPNAEIPSTKMKALHILFQLPHPTSYQGILLAVLRDLLEHDKIEVNARTRSGLTPLHFAVSGNNVQAIQMLLEHDDIEVNAQTNDGSTPLHFAVNSNNVQAVQMLLDHGAKIYKRTNDGSTPLHFAAGNDNTQVIKSLIEKVDQMENKNFINWRDSSGNTALFIAYKAQSRQAITELLRLGADPLLKNRFDISVNGKAHQDSRRGSRFAQFVLDEIDKYFQSRVCTPALTGRNEELSHVSN